MRERKGTREKQQHWNKVRYKRFKEKQTVTKEIRPRYTHTRMYKYIQNFTLKRLLKI